MTKILDGLNYIHHNDIVHCDLRAASILTTKDGSVKLFNFGASCHLHAIERESPVVVGSPNWASPEVIELRGTSTKSDIWSLGCTVIELLTGQPPYADTADGKTGAEPFLRLNGFILCCGAKPISNWWTVRHRMVENDRPPIPKSFRDPLVAFLKECFHKEPAQRPNAEELLTREWLKSHCGLMKV